MNYIIDRLTDEFAVCETEERTSLTIPRPLLPCKAKEGDVLTYEDGIYCIDEAASIDRRRQMKEKMAGLFE